MHNIRLGPLDLSVRPSARPEVTKFEHLRLMWSFIKLNFVLIYRPT